MLHYPVAYSHTFVVSFYVVKIDYISASLRRLMLHLNVAVAASTESNTINNEPKKKQFSDSRSNIVHLRYNGRGIDPRRDNLDYKLPFQNGCQLAGRSIWNVDIGD